MGIGLSWDFLIWIPLCILEVVVGSGLIVLTRDGLSGWLLGTITRGGLLGCLPNVLWKADGKRKP